MLYCSCLRRHSWASASPLPGKSSSPRAVTEKTSKSVPYASNAIASTMPPHAFTASTSATAENRVAALDHGQDDVDHVVEHRAVPCGPGHDRETLGAAGQEAGEGPQIAGGG